MDPTNFELAAAMSDVLMTRGDSSDRGFHFHSNSTSAEVNELKFNLAKSLRIAVITLSSVNGFVAALTVFGIFMSCSKAAIRGDPGIRIRNSLLSIIRPCDFFPLVLSFGIIAQSIGFAVAQSKGLSALLIRGCIPISRMMLPLIFITPFIQFAFGMETTMRALWPTGPFPKRAKWHVPACIGVVVLGVLVCVLVGQLTTTPNFCYASLFWFVQRWRLGCFVVFLIITALLLIGTIVTFMKLWRTADIEAVARMVASRTVYYMGMAVIENAFKVPFFFSLVFGKGADLTTTRIQLAMAAAIVANLSGIATALLYIYLRASKRASIGLRGYFEFDKNQQQQAQKPGAPGPFAYSRQIQQPVSPWRPGHRQNDSEFTFYSADSVGDEIREKEIDAGQAAAPSDVQAPEAARRLPSQNIKAHARKESYNLFPAKETANPNTKSVVVLPPVTYHPANGSKATIPRSEADNNSLIPAPLTINGWGHDESDTDTLIQAPFSVQGPAQDDADTDNLLQPYQFKGPAARKRGSSLGSSATVQIGLRLSNFQRMSQASVYSQDDPIGRDPSAYDPNYPVPRVPRAVSTLTVGTTNSTSTYGESFKELNVGTVDKQLPPIPLGTMQKATAPPADEGEQIRLSPTVYSPPAKTMRSKSSSPARGKATSTRFDHQRRKSARGFDADAIDWI